VRRKEIPFDKWKYTVAVSLFGSTVPAILFPLAQTHINSSLAGILNSMTPLWVMVLGALIFGVSLTQKRVGGILLGLLGAAALVLFRENAHSSVANTNNMYGLFIVLATCLYGISSNIIGRYMKGVDSIMATAMGLGTVGVPAFLYLVLCTNVPNMIFTMPAETNDATLLMPPFFYLAILAIVGTAFGSIGYVTLIQRTSPVFASVVTYIIPVFSIFFGVLDGETLSFVQLGGMALILSGVYLVNAK
jgi:drug/metabolite transporter (DMT)-like permease